MRLPLPISRPWLAICLAAATPALAETPPAPAVAPSLPEVQLSRTRRFSAQGADPRIAVPLLDWTEDIADRLEKALGAPLPCPPGTTFRLVLSEAPAPAGRPTLKRELAIGETGVSARLVVCSAATADPAALLDALVSLMLARHVIAAQPAAAWRERPRDAPDWFCCGLAAGLFPGPRARTQREALALWSAGRESAPARILRRATLPAGAHDDRAMAAAFVAWLRSRPDFPRIAAECMKVWAAGGTTDPARLARIVRDPWTAAELDQEWDLWLAGLRQFDAPWALTEQDLLERCREALALPRELIPVEMPADVPDTLTPAVLVERRREPWSCVAAVAMVARLDRIPCGQHPETARIVRAYRDTLSSLTLPPQKFPLSLFDARPGPARMMRRFAVADAALDDLEAVCVARAEAAPAAAHPDDPGRDFEFLLNAAASREIFRDAAARPGGGR